MTDAIRELFELLTRKEKSGSDYTGKVTSVSGNTAYVQFEGSDITNTPVALSIGASPGDTVRVRVADGRAWLIGNDSAPPNDSSAVAKALENTIENLSATNAELTRITTENIVGINGNINLKTGTFDFGSGKLSWNGTAMKISGWQVDGSGLYKDITINGVPYRAMIYAPSNAVAGTAAFAVRYYDSSSSTYKFPFCVHYNGQLSAGNLDATGGKIAGWDISSTQIFKALISDGYEYHPGLNAPASVEPVSYAFFVAKRTNDGNGNTGTWSYPFYVRYNGNLHAENAYISGEIQSSNGQIGGFTIGQETLSSDHISLASNDSTYGSLIKLWPSNSLLGVRIAPTAIVLNSAIDSSNVVTKYVDISNGGVTASHDIYAGGTLTAQKIDNNVGTIEKTYRMEMTGSSTSSGHGGYINFNYNKIIPSNTDWTNRIIAGNGVIYVRTGTTSASGVSGINGNLRFKTLAGNEDMPAVGSVTTAKEQVSHVRCSSATGFGVWGLWNTASTWSWMYASMTTSDPRLKDNIRPTELNALELVKKIPLYQFDWKADGKHWPVGFVAPELYDIDPAMVHKPDENEKNDMWGMEGFYMTGVLTKAVQELTEEVETLKGMVRDLMAEVKRLKGCEA